MAGLTLVNLLSEKTPFIRQLRLWHHPVPTALLLIPTVSAMLEGVFGLERGAHGLNGKLRLVAPLDQFFKVGRDDSESGGAIKDGAVSKGIHKAVIGR